MNLVLQPDQKADVVARAEAQFAEGAYEDALNSFLSAASLDSVDLTARTNAAVCLERLGRWTEAADLLKQTLETHPASPEALMGLAICYLHLENPGKALEALEPLYAATPVPGRARFAKAVALQLLSRFEEAIEEYREILTSEPDSAEVLANLVAIGMATAQEPLTREYSERLISLQPESTSAIRGLAACALWRQDYEEASRHCGSLVELVPEDTNAWFNLGISLLRSHHPLEAAKAFLEAMRLRCDKAQAAAVIAPALRQCGALEDARACCEQGLSEQPGNTPLAMVLACVLEEAGDAETAAQQYTKVLMVQPENTEAWFRLGCLRLAQEDPRTAFEAFQSAVRLRPEWLEALLNLALSSWRAGDLEEARQYYGEAVRLHPGSLEAVRGLAGIAIELRRYDEALDLHGRLIDLGDSSAELYFNTGLLLDKTGQREDAVRLYREALALNSQFSEALLNLGHVLKALGREDEARAVWLQAAHSDSCSVDSVQPLRSGAVFDRLS